MWFNRKAKIVSTTTTKCNANCNMQIIAKKVIAGNRVFEI